MLNNLDEDTVKLYPHRGRSKSDNFRFDSKPKIVSILDDEPISGLSPLGCKTESDLSILDEQDEPSRSEVASLPKGASQSKQITKVKETYTKVIRPDHKKRSRKVYRFVNSENISWRSRRRIQRAGIIPTFVDNRKMYFLLGLDRKFREWTDFGGSTKGTETGYETAMREMEEETLGILHPYLDMDHSSFTVIEQTMAVIFFPVHLSLAKIPELKEQYLAKAQQVTKLENSEIEVFTKEELIELIRGHPVHDCKMYELVSRHLIRKIIDIQHWSSPNVHSPEKK